MDYRDGVCGLTRVQSEGCVVLPKGVVFSNREVLLSEAGVDELGSILDNPEAHWQDTVCSITGEQSECVAIWGRLAPKRSIMLSQAGVDVLKSAIKSRPADYASKAQEAVKAAAKADIEAPATPPVPPQPDEPEPPPAEVVPLAEVAPTEEVPPVAAPVAAPVAEEKESKDVAEARVDREVAEMNLEEAEEALANMQEGDDESVLAAAIETAKEIVETAKSAEEAAKA